MHLPDNIFALTLLITGLISFGVGVAVFQKLGGTVRWFGSIILATAVWAITYAFELSSNDLQTMVLFTHLEYIGVATLPSLWIVFVMRFTGREAWLNKWGIALIFLEPLLTLIFKWTGAWGLQYQAVKVANSGPFPLLDITPGWWYRVHTIFFYAMLAWGIWMIVAKFKKAEGILRRQNRIILFGAMFPWVVNLIYLLHIRPFRHIDLTPFAFIATSLVIGIGLLRFRLFDIVPIAREKIIEALQEGILVTDLNGIIIDLNPRMKKTLQEQRASYIGSHIDELFSGMDLFKQAENWPKDHQLEINRKEQEQTRFYAVTVTPLFEKRTVYSGNVFLFRDITQLKHNEQKLEELNQLKDRLFSIIAHDLRTPMINLGDMIQLIESGDLNQSEFVSMLPELSRNITYTSGLVDNLLFWAKSQLSGATVNPVNFDLFLAAEHLLGLFQRSADDKGIIINNQVAEQTFVYADADMIQAVLRNLVNNAIKFCRTGDRVYIDAEVIKDELMISVKDTGVGISEENLSRIFALGNFTTRGTVNEQGTGLGLMLCQEFVEKNKGHIGVESAPGKGSRFYFTLPIGITASPILA
ncbi:sensor histidine kinase [Mucilaginibacter flavus]|uniref:sensor histidine kinase n=1 Tax=Mucilaginibacter flavus TaxID=931504 RepID=UPI0025B49BA5|nr:histidine kinase N-terminal 7TM domain-containing protein [Mucilaginibacter flavus]MDN3584458.1 histidine kinase N-terminal 7TM domain-containing protein [Mucilaginibacter flavus]